MKIIHTSDWHLGHKLYNYDRTDEEAHFFDQLKGVVAEEQPDAMVVSGDVFHTGTPGNDVAKCFTERLLEVQAQCPTMETVVIAGNHDSYSRLIVDQALWSRCRVQVLGVPGEDAEGKAVLARNVIAIGDKGVIAAVPFCHSRNFPLVEGGTGENREREYFAALAEYVKTQAGGKPAVLMAHLAVKGDIDLRGHDQTLVVGGEECVDAEELGSVYDYVALGHIHCPQWIKGTRKCARYCGTPRAIHFDEINDHGVDVVTVTAGTEPIVTTRSFKPLHALLTLGGNGGLDFADALQAIAETDCEPETYIRLNVRLGVGELPGPDWTEKARQACMAKGVRFCVNNPIRYGEKQQMVASAKTLTVAELKELSNDKVLDILSGKHELTARHRELLQTLMKEVKA